MKKIIVLFFFMHICFVSMGSNGTKDEDKSALLMVHFGTTFDDTRAATIDAINEKAKNEFPEMKVVEAYTSRIIISRLAKRGIVKPTPREALLKLAAEGYDHVFIQSTNVIDGIEAEALRNEADYMVPFFKDLRIGRPLLYSIEDCLNVEKILAERYSSPKGKNSAVVLIASSTSCNACPLGSSILPSPATLTILKLQ